MDHANLQVTLAVNHAVNQPLMLWGEPGTGKSSSVHQYAASQGLPVLDWRLTLMDSVDMRGTPWNEKGWTKWAPPIELDLLKRGERGILFLDELPQASMAVKNVAAMLVLERRIGEFRLPPGWWVCAAGNGLDHNAGTSPMPTHLNNRFYHVFLETSLARWIEWAEANEIDYRVIAYLRYRAEALLQFDPKSKSAAFPTPRTWHATSSLIKELDREVKGRPSVLDDTEPLVLGEWFAGNVGKARGQEFAGFIRAIKYLVTVPQILADPMNAPVSNDPSISYALATSLALQAKRDNVDAMFTYMQRIGKEHTFVFAKKVENLNPAMRKTKAFVTFCATNADYI